MALLLFFVFLVFFLPFFSQLIILLIVYRWASKKGRCEWLSAITKTSLIRQLWKVIEFSQKILCEKRLLSQHSLLYFKSTLCCGIPQFLIALLALISRLNNRKSVTIKCTRAEGGYAVENWCFIWFKVKHFLRITFQSIFTKQ